MSITQEEAFIRRPNTQVVKHTKLTANRPYPILLFVNNDEQLVNKSSFAVCLYNGVWHQVKRDTETGEPRAFNPSPSIHHWDIPSDKEQEEEEDVEEDPEDLEEPTQTDVAIRLTPVPS